MKKILLLTSISIIAILLAACTQTEQVPTAPAEPVSIKTQPVLTAEPATAEPQKFPMTYIDAAAGIELSYPEGWTLSGDQVVGERGSQAALLSPGSTLEMVADGGARIILVTYQWDPKNDLDAFIAQRKIAWDASGFIIESEESIDLGNGQKMVIFQIETTDQTKVLFAFTNSGENYLQVSGDGDLDLCREILENVTLVQ